VGITKLKSLAEESQYVCNNIKTIDFSTLHTTIPHTRLKSRIKELILRCFSKKNGEQMYQYLVIGRDKSSFVKNRSKSNNNYKQDGTIQMLDFPLIYLSSLMDECFNRRLVSQWIQIVLCYYPICFYTFVR